MPPPPPKRRSPPRRKDRSRSRSRSRSLSSSFPRKHERGRGRFRHISYHNRYRSRSRSRHHSHSPSSRTSHSRDGRRYSPSRDRSGSGGHSRRNFSPGRESWSHGPHGPPPHMKKGRCRGHSPPWSGSRHAVSSIAAQELGLIEPYREPRDVYRQSPQQRVSSPMYHEESEPYMRDKSPSPFRASEFRRGLLPEDSYSRVALGRATLQNIARQSLNDRFKVLDHDDIFHFDENITIGIHRATQGSQMSPRPIIRDFNPYDFVMMRQKNEGQKPIFDREEIKQFRHDMLFDDNNDGGDYEERRVVTVTPTDHQGYHGDRARDYVHMQNISFDDKQSSNFQWHDDDDVGNEREMMMRSGGPRGSKHEIFFDRPRDDFDYQFRAEGRDRWYHSGGRKKFDFRKERFDFRSRREFRFRRREDRFKKDEMDYHLGLPDFSKRPDKYKYEEWRDKPEMTPRGISYFEHDNRSDIDYYENMDRGRGRGRGRGQFRKPFRAGFRGGFRGRGRGSFKPPFRAKMRGGWRGRVRGRGRGKGGEQWKHDMFDKDVESKSKPAPPTK